MKDTPLITRLFFRLLRFLRITRPIPLSKNDVKWIKLIKGYKDDPELILLSRNVSWIDTLKPLFQQIYGYSPYKHPDEFLDTMFKRLLDIQEKIQENRFQHYRILCEIFKASFYKSVFRTHELPIERAIAELCGQIQCNKVTDRYGLPRYHLPDEQLTLDRVERNVNKPIRHSSF